LKKLLILAIAIITLLVPTAVMAAVPSESIVVTSEVKPEVSITIDNAGSIDFGSIAVGVPTVWSREITISNTGTRPITIDADLLTTLGTDANFYFNCLEITQKDGSVWPAAYSGIYGIPGEEFDLAKDWSTDVSAGGGPVIVKVRLVATAGYVGIQTGTITFMATLIPEP
jgi:hypothetical protein